MESRKASCFLGKHKSGIHLMEDMLSTWGRRRRSTIMKKAMKKMIMAGALCVAGAALPVVLLVLITHWAVRSLNC